MTNIIKKNTEVLDNRALIAGMKANNIVPSTNGKGGVIFTSCPMCEAEVLANPVYTKAILKGKPWYQATPAIVFKKANGATLKACVCGYRELVVITPKPTCPNCGSTLKHVGDRCYGPKCAPPSEAEADAYKALKTPPEVKTCVEPGCTNTVPEGRLVRCEACRAARKTPKEKVSSVEM